MTSQMLHTIKVLFLRDTVPSHTIVFRRRNARRLAADLLLLHYLINFGVNCSLVLQ